MAQISKISAGIQSMINIKLQEFISHISEIAVRACREIYIKMQEEEQEDLSSIVARIEEYEKQLIKLKDDATELTESIAKEPYINKATFANRLNSKGIILQAQLKREIDRISKHSQSKSQSIADDVRTFLDSNFV